MAASVIFFSISEADIKSKIQNLRVYFSRELAKVSDTKKSEAGTDKVYVSKWPHFQSLQFLRDIMVPRKSQYNMVNIFLQYIILQITIDLQKLKNYQNMNSILLELVLIFGVKICPLMRN